MKFDCPECGNSIEIGDRSAVKVRCDQCSTVVAVPSLTAVTETPQSRPKFADEEELPRERPPSEPSSRGSNVAMIVGILLVVAVPILLLLSCVGVSALVTLATHDDMQVAVAPAPMAAQVKSK
jgi:hypothetical protein